MTWFASSRYQLSSSLVLLLALLSPGCMEAYRKTVASELPRSVERMYLTDMNTAWSSVIEALKSIRIDVSNREGGFIQTKWTDNTLDKNFVNSFGGVDTYLKSQYRLKINLSPGAYNGKPVVRLAVLKEQLVQKDVLEGWKPVETDTLDENTLLYRISRIIFMRMKMAQIEEQKKQKALESTTF